MEGIKIITCINLSNTRKSILNKYNDLLLDYKLKYTNEQIQMHKNMFKTTCKLFGLYLIHQYFLHGQSCHASNYDPNLDGMMHDNNNYLNNMIKGNNKYVNDMYNTNQKYINKYWDSMSKSIDDALKPTFDYVDKAMEEYLKAIKELYR